MNDSTITFLHSVKTMDWKAVAGLGALCVPIFWMCLDTHNAKIFETKEEAASKHAQVSKSLDRLEQGQQKLIDHLLSKGK